MSNEKVALIILDGYGIGEPNDGNAIYMAQTPVMDSLLQRWPHTKLSASGLDVGLPDGQMGNSEVGHTNIGSGRVVFQDLPRITKAIEDGRFLKSCYAAALTMRRTVALHSRSAVRRRGSQPYPIFCHGLAAIAEFSAYLHCFLDGAMSRPRARWLTTAARLLCRARHRQDRDAAGPLLRHGPR
ncbi:MAG: hypothetical protein ACLTG4_10585 [Oscillospiraceae bacterium]